ncbi:MULTISPECIES: hypothetical protein [unclassified Thioalkalivibrio]|uniref:hypothetical protein n=1 Tax=unclassified Thioalkalivibrio TaxID=2621013 RepID=UPI000370FE0A|nr:MULTISPECIES: hypothetical protein [unclassified Thioalkalivibrio]
MRPLIPMLLALASAPALAHPGHGHGEGFSLSHWLSAPEHAWSLGLLAMVIVAGRFARRWQRRRSRR